MGGVTGGVSTPTSSVIIGAGDCWRSMLHEPPLVWVPRSQSALTIIFTSLEGLKQAFGSARLYLYIDNFSLNQALSVRPRP